MKLFGFNISRASKEKKEVFGELTQEQASEIMINAIKEAMNTESFVTADSVEMPSMAGRSSVSELRNPLINTYSTIPTDYPFNLLPLMENLAIYNTHFSYAVENIITLAATNFTFEFDESVPEKQAKLMRQHLDGVMGQWYEYSDGLGSLINDLFFQCAVFGGISAERVIREDLSGIKEIIRVPHKDIRFSYDSKIDEFKPVQKVTGVITNRADQNGFVDLNRATYSYIAMKRFKATPYAIPPFITAIESIFTEKEMLDSFKNMIKRVGTLGFLSVLLKAPALIPGETPQAYQTRMNQYLKDQLPMAESSFAKGVALGYKDSHEFEVTANNLDARGADGLMKIIKSLVYAGLKQDPNMHGENYSTTETFGRVILEKMIKQCEFYQKTVAFFLEVCIMQELMLAGFNPGKVKGSFAKPMVSDQYKEAQADSLKFDVLKKEFDQGLIDQTTFAIKRGYDAPAESEPRAPIIDPNSQVSPTGDNQKKKSFSEALEDFRKGEEYIYDVPEECIPISYVEVTDFHDDKINKIVKQYVGAVEKQFRSATQKASTYFEKKIESFTEATNQSEWIDAMWYAILHKLEENYITPIKPITGKNVSAVYNFYRKDDKIFKNAKGYSKATSFIDIPDAIFDTIDYRTVDYLKASDSLYLGKFITDRDSVKRINQWLIEQFEKGELPVGKNSDALNAFMARFEDVVDLETWKIRRVIETTANKARAYSSVNYMNQAGVDKFEVVEILDNRTCPWCAAMDSKEFSVDHTVDLISKVASSDIEEVGKITPFATSVKIDEFKKLDESALQARGIATPPFHPHCRGRIISVL